MSKKLKRIGVFTSGGDAPGMNAALRAVVRTAAFHDVDIYAIKSGYEGMIAGAIEKIEVRKVGNILQRGGTIIKTARSQRFMTPEGRLEAFKQLKKHKIGGCVALGGNGTFTGAEIFSKEHGIPFVGVPCTIDNDLYGTDFTIGFDTAVNTAVQAVDKIRDTAESHNRLFFIEVMGRNAGFIALHTAIASGAGNVLLPEIETTLPQLVGMLREAADRGKMFSVVIVSEGTKMEGGIYQIAKQVQAQLPDFDVKVTVVGHMQRGGSPSASDRILASRLGNAAVEALLDGIYNVMVGLVNHQIKHTPLSYAVKNEKELNVELIRLAEILAI